MAIDRLVKIIDGLFGRYYPSGKRAIQAQFFYRGARCRETLEGLDPDVKSHVRMAKNRMGAIQDAITRDTFSYLEYFPNSKRARMLGLGGSRTVKEIGESWLADMIISLSPSTYRSYAGPMTRFVYPAIGKLKARDVTPEHLRDMFRTANISLKTARNYSIPLQGLFKRALDDGDVSANPFDRVTVKQLIPKSKHRSEYKPDPLTANEIELFLAACDKHRPKWTPYWAVAFFTGMRPSELYGLRWDDWRDTELDVRRAIVERGLQDYTKTAAGRRTIQLAPRVIQAIKAQREQTAFREHVFWNACKGTPLVDNEVTQRIFNRICKAAGLRTRPQYQTRHSYATNMLEQNESPRFIAEQMGHTSVEMLFRRYTKWMPNTATYVPRGNFGAENVS